MSSRGEASFAKLPAFGAKLYNSLTHTRAIRIQLRETAQDLVSRMGDRGRLLDVGTGPGWLLFEIYRLNPTLALYGLDISAAMVEQARQNLAGLNVDLRQGNIRSTNYDRDFFDIVTCTGSFYLWDKPTECLEELFRILKAGHSAYLYETHPALADDEFQAALKANLQQEGPLRKVITPFFLKRQLKMTYHPDEIARIIQQTRFAQNFALDKITLAGLPIWLRIRLTK